MADNLTQKLNDELARLNELVGLDLYTQDGKPNYENFRRVLNDPQYSRFREDNPQVVQDMQKSLNTARLDQGLQLGNNLLKAGIGASQLKSAQNVNTRTPRYPKRKDNLNLLRKQLSQANSAREMGLTPTQKAELQRQSDRTITGAQRQLIATSGGQSSATQAGLQRLAQEGFNQQKQITNLDEQARRTSQRRADSLLNQVTMENERNNQQRERGFYRREFPLARMRNQAQERLMQSGIRNVVGGTGAISNNLVNMAKVLGPDMPGMQVVRPDTMYDPRPEQRLYDRQLTRLGTGTNFMQNFNAFNNPVPQNALIDQLEEDQLALRP